MQGALAILVIVLLAACSVWVRVRDYRAKLADVTNSQPSPLSMALQDLLAAAGGVYLSLIMLISFLKLDIPDKVQLMLVSMDPVAIASLALAIIQPFVLKLFHKK